MQSSDLAKKIKQLRIQQGLSQEALAEQTGLSLRTIQRIENGESEPRGDSLKRLAAALQSAPDELIEWQPQADPQILKVLTWSQLGFLAFPILGIALPLVIWIWKKETVKHVDALGKSIINFQATWTIGLSAFYLLFSAAKILHLKSSLLSMPFALSFVGGLYAYNLFFILRNSLLIKQFAKIKYLPAFKFLGG